MADVTLPQLGETVTEGTITQWFKQVGDSVAADEPLFEVSTDKVDTEVPSPVAGTILEIRANEGDTVEVGEVIAVVGDADDATDNGDTGGAESEPEPASEPEPEPDAKPEPEPESKPEPAPTGSPQSKGEGGGDNRLLSPVVRRLVNEHGLDPSDITGTGPGGRITREDVLDHIDATGSAPSRERRETAATSATPAPTSQEPPADAQTGEEAKGDDDKGADAGDATRDDDSGKQPAVAETAPARSSDDSAPVRRAPALPTPTPGDRDTVTKLSKIRRLTGDHMVASKATSPHAFSVVEVDYANVDVTRSRLKAEWKQAEGFSLTYLPFIARAVIDALGEFPHLNASVGDDALFVHGYVDLGIAVDLEYEGLLAPVVRNAETKRLKAIAREIHDLADRARTRKLSPDEIQGGTFTLTNNGSAGSVLTMPIINQPQVAIVSTDAIVRKPVVVDVDGGEGIAIHPVGNLAMAWDHRAFDGAYAAGFLKRVKELLETRDWGVEV